LRNRAGYEGSKTSTAILVQGAGAVKPTVTSVTVSAAAASVAKGGTLQFTAAVSGTNNPSQDVSWTIVTSGKASGTSISATGLLTVAANETLTSLTVGATSTVDTTKSDTETVTVTGSNGNGGDGPGDGSVPETNVQVYYKDGEPFTGSTGVYYRVSEDDNDEGVFLEAGSITSGKLTLNLPQTIAPEYLFDTSAGVPTGITVSPSGLKMTQGGLYIGVSGGYRPLGYEKETESGGNYWFTGISYVYFSAAGTIQGGFADTEDGYTVTMSFNVDGKAGWNRVYITAQGTGSGTTESITSDLSKVPSDLKWTIYGSSGDDLVTLFEGTPSEWEVPMALPADYLLAGASEGLVSGLDEFREMGGKLYVNGSEVTEGSTVIQLDDWVTVLGTEEMADAFFGGSGGSMNIK
jgi:hypothetical protein